MNFKDLFLGLVNLQLLIKNRFQTKGPFIKILIRSFFGYFSYQYRFKNPFN